MAYLILVTMRQKQFLFISIIQNKYVYEIKFYCLSIFFTPFKKMKNKFLTIFFYKLDKVFICKIKLINFLFLIKIQ